jgi:hypothetical protein
MRRGRRHDECGAVGEARGEGWARWRDGGSAGSSRAWRDECGERLGKGVGATGRPLAPAASTHRYGRIATRTAGAVLGDRVPPTQFRRATPSRARLWWLASASPRRLVVNPARAGRQQRQRRCRVPEPELVRAAS